MTKYSTETFALSKINAENYYLILESWPFQRKGKYNTFIATLLKTKLVA